MKLGNENVTIELKNGLVVQGTVSGVDVFMNTQLKAVKVSSRGGGGPKEAKAYDTYMVRGTTIRSIILPESLPLESLLTDDRTRVRTGRELVTRGKQRGRTRARLAKPRA